MVFLGSFQTLSICKDAAGIAGNISALVLFVSPVPTFRRIIRNESTEQFSGLPYIYALLNCIICAWYGSPLISSDNLSVTTVNSVGAVFQIVYIILFIIYAEKTEKVRVIGLLLAVLGIFAVIVIGSLLIIDLDVRHVAIGFLSSASLVSMLASPLFIIAPNGIGTVLAIIQLVLFSYYKNASRDNSVVPLLVSHDMINGKEELNFQTWAAVEEGRLSSS
ncbi:bidirectional sugar transporter SWEET2-like isoform X3 [Olea europaea var. sylvestris]|uniref:bidirectional sugar transporter SWEET2-like isoform X3 n=1 Tax=Olea europaea var. sylvestris TaxID=158386 RepID=UPI000C1D3DF5|nr:bidirectional sugar transporter SWEET2-like isoform X3 [Olea europaea var. sylvestris]